MVYLTLARGREERGLVFWGVRTCLNELCACFCCWLTKGRWGAVLGSGATYVLVWVGFDCAERYSGAAWRGLSECCVVLCRLPQPSLTLDLEWRAHSCKTIAPSSCKPLPSGSNPKREQFHVYPPEKGFCVCLHYFLVLTALQKEVFEVRV